MNELVKITEQNGKRAVNARELHQFLESKQEFANWIKGRIEKYGFIEGQDFTSFDNFVKRETGSSVRKEYALSVDMAKELSMVENNEKGKQARRYFIECEKATTKQTSFLEDKLKVIDFATRFLNLNDASKLKMLKAVTEPLGLPTPDYVPSKGILKSASELLKEYNAGISAQAFNKLAIKEGYLEEKIRKASNGKSKFFKSITSKGENFGENQVSPNNPKETQPSWYEDKFDELLKNLLGE
jgi:phage anti-repressor protein